MGIDWPGIGQEIKKRRERLKHTQDWVASKIGVRLATIARLEIGTRRPSLSMLEMLSEVLECQVTDLIIEKENTMIGQTADIREPSMKGAPSFFRGCVRAAATQEILGETIEGKAIRVDYAHPGYHFAIHVDQYLTEEALQDFERIADEIPEFEPINNSLLQKTLMTFFEQEFPQCIKLIPVRKRDKFFEGVLRAIEEERCFPI